MGLTSTLRRRAVAWLFRSDTVGGLTAQNAWDSWTAGRESSSGVSVTVTKMLACSAWYSVIDLISSDIGSLGMFLFARLDPTGKRRAKEHPVYRLVHHEPNTIQNSFEFFKWMVTMKLIYGNGYAEIERNNRGEPIALWPIHPTRVEPLLKGDALVYRVSGSKGDISQRDMIHIKGHSNDGYVGIGLIELARDSIGLTITAEEFGAFFFRNKAQPSILISVPDGTLGDEEKAARLRREWMVSHSKEKVGGVGFVEDATKVTVLGMTNKDAQYNEIRDYQLTEACRFSHVPPHMVMKMEQSTLNNIEHQSIQYNQMALMPHIKPIEQEFTKKLVGFDGDLYCGMELKALLRADMKSRSEALDIMRRNGVINADHWADLEDMNPLPDGLGQTYILPVNMEPAEITKAKAEAGLPPLPTTSPRSAAAPPDEGAARRERTRAAFKSLVVSAIQRLARVEADKAERASKRPDTYRAWCEKFHVEHRDRVRSELATVFAAYRETVGNPPTPVEIEAVVDAHLTALAVNLRAADTDAILKADHTQAVIESMFTEN